jgi:hypothetical protein
MVRILFLTDIWLIIVDSWPISKSVHDAARFRALSARCSLLFVSTDYACFCKELSYARRCHIREAHSWNISLFPKDPASSPSAREDAFAGHSGAVHAD